MNAFTAPHCQDDEAARELIESIRWPNGPVCGHCGESERRYATKRPGRYRCGNPDCRKDYTATTGTVMESSHIPLHKWMMGFYLMAASKKGVSAHQLHRSLGVTYKSAWFMAHRIREAMRVSGLDPLGGAGKVVEADETYFGKVDRPRARNKYLPPVTKGGKSGPSNKRPIVALVKRGGSVRTFHVAVADKATVGKIVADNVDRESYLYTDESRLYGDADQLFAEHETVKHSAGVTYTAILPNTIFATTIASGLASAIRIARAPWSRAPKASGSPTDSLTAPVFRFKLARLLRHLKKGS